MNLYKLHTQPETLYGYTPELAKIIPIIMNIKNGPGEDGDSVGAGFEIMQQISELGLAGNEKIEAALLGETLDGAYNMYMYATDILGRRWPEAEKYIKQEDWIWEQYLEELAENGK